MSVAVRELSGNYATLPQKQFDNPRKLANYLKKLVELRGNAYLGSHRVQKFYTSFDVVLARTANSEGQPVVGLTIKFDNFHDIELVASAPNYQTSL